MSVAPRVAKAAKDVKRKAPTHLWLAGGSVVLGTIYSTYQYITYHKDASEAVKSLDPDAGRTFEQLSDIYDKAVGVEETWMGFGLLRWWLMKYAEVSSKPHGATTHMEWLAWSAWPAPGQLRSSTHTLIYSLHTLPHTVHPTAH